MGMVNLNDKQKEIILKVSEGWFLYNITFSSGPSWTLTEEPLKYIWGNVHGMLFKKLKPFIEPCQVSFGVYRYHLTEMGKELAMEIKNSKP